MCSLDSLHRDISGENSQVDRSQTHMQAPSYHATCPPTHPLSRPAHHNQHEPKKKKKTREARDKRQKENSGGAKCWAWGMPFSVYSQKGGKRECQRKCHGAAVSPPGRVRRANTHPLRIRSLHILEGRRECARSTQTNESYQWRFPVRKAAAVRSFPSYVFAASFNIRQLLDIFHVSTLKKTFPNWRCHSNWWDGSGASRTNWFLLRRRHQDITPPSQSKSLHLQHMCVRESESVSQRASN